MKDGFHISIDADREAGMASVTYQDLSSGALAAHHVEFGKRGTGRCSCGQHVCYAVDVLRDAQALDVFERTPVVDPLGGETPNSLLYDRTVSS